MQALSRGKTEVEQESVRVSEKFVWTASVSVEGYELLSYDWDDSVVAVQNK